MDNSGNIQIFERINFIRVEKRDTHTVVGTPCIIYYYKVEVVYAYDGRRTI